MPFPAQRCSEACHEVCCEAWCEAYCCAEFAAASCYGLLPWRHEKRWTDRTIRARAIDPDFASRHLGVRFVPGFVSDETRLGCVYIETLAWKARKQPPRDLTRIAHAQQRSLL